MLSPTGVVTGTGARLVCEGGTAVLDHPSQIPSDTVDCNMLAVKSHAVFKAAAWPLGSQI